MENTNTQYTTYLNILKEELVPAMGCTEPIAIAYAAAMARKVLGALPERIEVEVSSNIIKNVKSVVVPNTGNLKGIEAAAVAGVIAGDSDKVLEVISKVCEKGKKDIAAYLQNKEVKVINSQSGLIFDIIVTVFSNTDEASVQISHFHTNIVKVTKNGKTLVENLGCNDTPQPDKTDRSQMTVKGIFDFAQELNVSDVKEMLTTQITYNTAIANEGIKGKWGANVGSVLLNTWGNDVKVRAKAMAAAGSDARMSGCELPVVIVSGSGNQGLATSLPVIEYARDLKVDNDKLMRALVLANLVTIHQKTGIGRLSAYCGAISAGIGAGAGIAYLLSGEYKVISHTIVNALAIVSGIVCDGAKPSCAGKIASGVEAGILGYHMYKDGQQFLAGDGIVEKGVENTIKNVSRLGSIGMRETDKEIIKMMLGE
ncbi:serine dehydratase subunit alpha family protein [Saccharicrinis aurantiacus]|uniref:L-cysteine desulfidase family protein n=1 Tax=Saccharicrinis aurantiacus TaxID=1849719 RepID=UPI0009501AF9|nr:L-serine ammonia-lyase, iron-sulfur-dependent, subunit alpha [Saccharicrinis aurantiacus]